MLFSSYLALLVAGEAAAPPDEDIEMSNSYYTASGNPLTRSLSSSAQLRAELSAIQGAFDRLPDPIVGEKGFADAQLDTPTLDGATVTGTSVWYGGALHPDKLGIGYAGSTYATPSAAFGTVGYAGFYRSSKTGNPLSLVVASDSLPEDDDYLLFDKYGNVIFGDGASAKAADATNGFLMIPKTEGTPTGTPANLYASSVPLLYDSTNNKLYVYDGAWLATAALS